MASLRLVVFVLMSVVFSSALGQEISRKTTEDIAAMANDIESQYTCKKPIRLFSSCDFNTNPMMEVQKDNTGMTTVHLEKEKHQVKGVVVSENCVVNVYQHAFKHGVTAFGAGTKNAGLLIKGPKRVCVGKALHKVKTITIEDTADAGTLATKMDQQNAEAVQKLNTFQTNLKITMAKLKGEIQAQKVRVSSKGPKGATGDKGFRGDAGLDGKDGETGATGEIGEEGNTGSTGATGMPGVVGASVTGPRGNTGATGTRGNRGSTGEEGEMGPTGLIGATGIAPTGPAGHTGATGSTGGAKKPAPLKFTKRAKQIYHKIINNIRKTVADVTGATGAVGVNSVLPKKKQTMLKGNKGVRK